MVVLGATPEEDSTEVAAPLVGWEAVKAAALAGWGTTEAAALTGWEAEVFRDSEKRSIKFSILHTT